MDFFEEDEFEQGRSAEDKLIIGSAGLGGFLILAGIFSYMSLSPQPGMALLFLGLVIGVLPYAVVSFLENRAIREMEDHFPSFLKDLAESKRGGMTIIQAFESARETDYGRLNREIERIHNELTWGLPFPEVMQRFSRRMEDSSVIQESVSILLQSFQSGGNITRTIEAIGEDSSRLKETMQKKDSKIKQQVIIMYVIYFLFIAITIGIYIMLAQLLALGEAGSGALENMDFMSDDGQQVTTNFCSGEIRAATPMCETAKLFGFVPSNVTDFSSNFAEEYSYGNMAYYKSLLFWMLMIQGIATGAVAGQISEGSPAAGIKHGLVMLPVAFLAFMYVVGLSGV